MKKLTVTSGRYEHTYQGGNDLEYRCEQDGGLHITERGFNPVATFAPGRWERVEVKHIEDETPPDDGPVFVKADEDGRVKLPNARGAVIGEIAPNGESTGWIVVCDADGKWRVSDGSLADPLGYSDYRLERMINGKDGGVLGYTFKIISKGEGYRFEH